MALKAGAMLLLAGAMIGGAARADEPKIEEIRKAWTACERVIASNADGWIGWRRDYFNGYGDNFSFWNNAGSEPSVLRTSAMIDAIALVSTTYCFRTDGTLAFILTIMTSPGNSGAEGMISREGRIYVGPDGAILKVLGQILDDKKQLHPFDDPDWQLARGCEAVKLYKTRGEVEQAYIAELGDIEGKRPVFAPGEFNWCANVAQP